MVFLGVLEENRYFCVMCCVPISGYRFAGTEDRSAWLRVFNRFSSYFQPFYAMQEGNWWMADHEPARRGEGSKCVLPTFYSHFSWRSHRGMVFGEQQV